MFFKDDKLKDECGVIGYFDVSGNNISHLLYYGLLALQHRGEISCGIATDQNGKVTSVKGSGPVSEVFDDAKLAKLRGNMGIGHVRYNITDDASNPLNFQPIVSRYCKGTFSIAHNGNITNSNTLKQELEKQGSIFQTACNCEIVTHLFARERTKSATLIDAVLTVMDKLQGAYSFVIMSPDNILGIRDPSGYRPLCIGKKENGYIIASESVALDMIGAKFVRDVEPGEIVQINSNGLISHRQNCKKNIPSLCIFEYIYFARPDSIIDGVSVYETRIKLGQLLAKEHPSKGDVVIGVPSSGLHFALGYSQYSKIPFGDGLIRNSYIGRGVNHVRMDRKIKVNLKLNVLKAGINDKDVILVDDSMLRGTTMRQIVAMMKENGARTVNVRIASPMIKYDCNYGIDVPQRKNLIATSMDKEQIRLFIGADSLEFLSLDSLDKSNLNPDFGYCKKCFIF